MRITSKGQVTIPREIREAVKDIEKYFNSPEWKAKVESLDCSKVQTRVKDLEKRLADLEKRLNEK